MKLIDAFLQYLKVENVEVVFGVPGGLLHPFFAAIEQDPQLRLMVTKHEEGAAFMADGYARTSGRLGVCAGTAGPGSTNLITGVAVAHCDGVPMLVITGQAPSMSIGKGAAQEMAPQDVDIVGMFRPITKYSAAVESPERLEHHLRRALRQALTGRPGPVHLNIPVDFWGHEVKEEVFRPEFYRPRTEVFDRNAVVEATHALASAKHPIILAGSGIATAGAKEELMRFAEQLSISVATTPRAKGVFPEDHPLSLGVLGFAGHRSARDSILGNGCDVLFVAGASLNEATTYSWTSALLPAQKLIHMDIDVDRIGRNYPVDIALVGHAKTIFKELYFHVKRQLNGDRVNKHGRQDTPALMREDAYHEPQLRNSDAVPITPQRWRREFVDALPHNAMIFSDVGGHMLFNIHDLRIGKGQDFYLNLSFGSMGHGTCAPIGARLANPKRPTFAIIGDACFTMNGMELLVASEYEVPVIWIVENNQMHGITHHGSKMVGMPMDAIVYKRPLDISGIAKAMGLEAFDVFAPGEIEDVITEALARNRPAVINVHVDPTISPPLSERAYTIGGDNDE